MSSAFFADLKARIGLDDAEFQKGMDKTKATLKKGVRDFADSTKAMAVASGVGLAAVTSTMSAEQNKWKLKAQLGLSPSESAKLGKAAGELYSSNYGESLDEVNTAIGAVKTNLKDASSPKTLKSLTKQALSLSSALGIDATESVRAVSQMMRTGLAKNSQEAFDIIATGSQNGANKAGDLVDTFNEYGTQFRKLGIDGKTALGLIQQGLQGGARDSDLVADSLKEFSLRAIDGSDNTMNTFKALGLNAEAMAAKIGRGGESASAGLKQTLDALRAMKDPVKREAAAVALFGTQAEDMGAALFKLDPASAAGAKGMEKLSGASKRLTGDMDKASNPFETFRRQAVSSLGEVGTKALPLVTPLLKTVAGLAPALGPAAAGFAGLWGVVKVGTVAVDTYRKVSAAAIVVQKMMAGAALGTRIQLGLLAVRQKALAGATLAGKAATAVATAVQWAWNAAMTANPIGLVILAIVALIGIFVVLFRRNKAFRDGVLKVWAAIKLGVGAAVHAVGAVIKTVFAAIGGYIRFQVKVWMTAIRVVLAIPRIIGGAVKAAYTAVRVWVGKIVGKVRSMGSSVKNFFSDAGSWLVDKGRDIVRGLLRGLKSMATAPVDFVRDMAGDIASGFAKVLGIHSPSRVFIDHGENTGEGAIVGMRNKLRAIRKAAGDLGAAAAGGFGGSGVQMGLTTGRGGSAGSTVVHKTVNLTVPIPAGMKASDAGPLRETVTELFEELLTPILTAMDA